MHHHPIEDRIAVPGQYRIEERFEDTLEIDGLTLQMAGLIAKRDDGNAVIGSAAAVAEPAFERAYYELLERACVLIAHERGDERPAVDWEGTPCEPLPYAEVFPLAPGPSLAMSRTNGAALHVDPAAARAAALAELCERDRILRTWYGEGTPRPIALPGDSPCARLAERYELGVYRFDQDGDPIAVTGVFGFPRRAADPCLMGFGAADDPVRSFEKAQGETLQRLAFLFGEDIPQAPPPAEPTPDYHQEHFLHPPHAAALRTWLAGDHARDDDGRPALAPLRLDTLRFAVLTPRGLQDRVTAVRAVAEGAMPLVFGRREHLDDTPLPAALQVHPIA